MEAMRVVLVAALAAGLAGCGGGGGGGSTASPGGSGSAGGSTGSSGSSGTPAPPASTLAGVAASGSPIVGRIYLKDSTGQEQHVDTTDGHFSFTLTGLTAPFMLKAQWSANSQVQNLYSLASQQGTANITPLTQLLAMAAARATSLDSLYATPGQGLAAALANLPAAESDAAKSLAPLLASFGQTGVDPITTAFNPDHTGMDALLDSITLGTAGNDVTLTSAQGGALVLSAPVAHLGNALAVPDWSTSDGMAAYHPDVAIDANGRGLAVWSEVIAGHSVIRARLLDGSGAAATTVSTAGDSANPRVAIDASGNALLVWEQYQNNRNTIWASRFLASTKAWATPLQLSDPTPVADAAGPVVAVDQAGNALAAWTEGNGVANHFDIWSARFSAAQPGWTTAAIVSDTVDSAHDPEVAVNAAGQGMLAWAQDQTVGSNVPMDIWARTATTAGAWGQAVRINAVPGSSNTWLDNYFALAMDGNGNAGALWVQNATSSGPTQVNAAMFVAGTGWQPSQVITASSASSFRFPVLAFDAQGNAFSVWREYPGNGAGYGSAAAYVAGTGWGPLQTFASNPQAVVMDPRLAVDGGGNATIVWYDLVQGASSYTVNVNSVRHMVDTGWGAIQQISAPAMDGFSTCPAPRAAANAAGQAVMIWGYSDNTC